MPDAVTSPTLFRDALEARAVKTKLPTGLRTKDLQRLSAPVRERAFFSAGVENVRFLDEADKLIEGLIRGDISPADARVTLDRVLAKEGMLDPDRKLSGDLQELSSRRRQDVLLDTNVRQARGYGQWKIEQEPQTLNLWPAKELIRVANREVPREWRARWQSRGGSIFNGRMVALKNAPIWSRISRFSLPYPPFDFNSGMGTRAIDREEAQSLGLIAEDDDMVPEDRGFNKDLESSLDIRSQRLRDRVAQELQGIATIQDGVLQKLPVPAYQTADEQGLPPLNKVGDPVPDPGRQDAIGAIGRLERGVDVTDPLGNRRSLNQDTMNHWKLKGSEIERSGYLDRAIDTIQNPLEIWDNSNQTAYIARFAKDEGGASNFVVFTRPNGTVDNFFTTKSVKNTRKGKRIYIRPRK